MRYFGGKTRICKDIAQVLISVRKPGQVFLSPFIGGGWVEALIPDPKICCDKHKYLIAMYQALQKGWKPPQELSKNEYQYVQTHMDEKPYLTGFVGFGCSFAGKWFGGYADETNPNSVQYQRDDSLFDSDCKPSLKSRNFCLNAFRSVMNKKKHFGYTEFRCTDIASIEPHDMLIYCDPPYAGTTQYDKKVVGCFDHDLFWETMRKWGKDNTVLVSEYNAPDDFKCIWTMGTKTDMKNKNNSGISRTEKLFTPNQDFCAGYDMSCAESI